MRFTFLARGMAMAEQASKQTITIGDWQVSFPQDIIIFREQEEWLVFTEFVRVLHAKLTYDTKNQGLSVQILTNEFAFKVENRVLWIERQNSSWKLI
ncbi:hypothetical protein [Streptococcus ovuberis]|uniref:Uncharacterized protein n=1 Tax=Streptococcus ovuberis TaxID=1936207 RepID=A0A7X6MYN5_9STRE|nr:hypothetical protein [Streptococcus ovuberis]NKZ20183.1 hypothetical protein [Streptococcus ovuberis]